MITDPSLSLHPYYFALLLVVVSNQTARRHYAVPTRPRYHEWRGIPGTGQFKFALVNSNGTASWSNDLD